MVSHEVKNVCGPVIGFADLVQYAFPVANDHAALDLSMKRDDGIWV